MNGRAAGSRGPLHEAAPPPVRVREVGHALRNGLDPFGEGLRDLAGRSSADQHGHRERSAQEQADAGRGDGARVGGAGSRVLSEAAHGSPVEGAGFSGPLFRARSEVDLRTESFDSPGRLEARLPWLERTRR